MGLAAILDRCLANQLDPCCVSGPSEPTYSDTAKLSHEANQWIEELNRIDASDRNSYQTAVFQLAGYYTHGATIEWERLSANTDCRLIALPLYPFSRDRYWFKKPTLAAMNIEAPIVPAKLHPLVHQQVASTEHRAATRTPTSPSGRAYARSGLRPNFDFVPRMAGEQGITIGALDTGDGP